MIEIRCPEHFKAAVAFGKGLGGKSWASFRDSLRRLNNVHNYRMEPGYARRQVVKLYKDFVPHSFEFAVFNIEENGTEKFIFNGGLICHGAGSGGMAELSITLSPKPFVNWQIHT
jgi:hypothetical protein